MLLALAFASLSAAGPYEDGEVAFKRKDYVMAMARWRPLAEAGDARAQSGVAAMYFGGLGVVRDDKLAQEWCTKAAEQGEPRAQYLLASMYRDGRGLEKDPIRALTFFRKAADQDYHWAQYSLGLMYLIGEGGPPDYLDAYFWLSLAAVMRADDDEEVHSIAAYLLDQAADKLTAEEVVEIKKRSQQWKPAQR
jgi:TPR repeat protein